MGAVEAADAEMQDAWCVRDSVVTRNWDAASLDRCEIRRRKAKRHAVERTTQAATAWSRERARIQRQGGARGVSRGTMCDWVER
jgi:hypothetical protein